MSLERTEFGSFKITCEKCGSGEIFSSDYFETLNDAEADGWVTLDKTAFWFCCEECKEEYVNGN